MGKFTPRVCIIGGTGYSATGGIPAVNRVLVRELLAADKLDGAYFLWDTPADAEGANALLGSRDLVKGFSLSRHRMLWAMAKRAAIERRLRWLCTHVNYAVLGMALTLHRWDRYGVLLHAAEMDQDFTALKRLSLRRAGFVIAVSEFTKKKAISHGVRESRVRVLYNGVPDKSGPGSNRAHRSERFNILFVGRMDESYKGQLVLLEAVALLIVRVPSIHLTFVGGAQSLEKWRYDASVRGISQNVTFAGRVSDEELNRYYTNADVFAMPSENEGFGLVYAEAMSFAIPCVGSERDAASEVIDDGVTGFCVPSGNPTALAGVLLELAKSPILRRNMGDMARKRYLERFSMPIFRGNLLQLINGWTSS